MYNTIVVREKQKKQTRNDQDGSLAQLGEHLPYKQRVIGSSPITSTITYFGKRRKAGEFDSSRGVQWYSPEGSTKTQWPGSSVG